MAKRKSAPKGKLKIGDSWNAITIIALSQNNPLKAIAEFVENSIDAGARHVTITKGRERGETYLRIVDDGNGVPKDPEGKPDFKYVATHICDSIKRKLKTDGATGIQGEFGIGLLSFWTVGESMRMTCAGTDGHSYQMTMQKGDPGYSVQERRALFSLQETELVIKPLLSGVKVMSGEKIHWYLSAELRDRLRHSGVDVKVVDRVARKTFTVEPRVFDGTPITIPTIDTPLGDVHVELYINTKPEPHTVALSRLGTRVMADIVGLPHFQNPPWNSGMVEGVIDAGFLHLTPGTRDGVIQDDAYDVFERAIRVIEPTLLENLEAHREAEEQRASKLVLKTVQRALREALLMLPQEEYDWFDLNRRPKGSRIGESQPGESSESADGESPLPGAPARTGRPTQKQFFEYEGDLFSVVISPSSCDMMVNGERGFRAVTRDKSRRPVERDLSFRWRIQDGGGDLRQSAHDVATYVAPAEPGLTVLEVVVSQGSVECHAEAMITVTDTLTERLPGNEGPQKGLPGYTYSRAPGEVWRSRYDETKNLIIINNGHRDFVHASKVKARKVRYICRLFAKELVQKNFPGVSSEDLLERMVELLLYTEDHLK